jgi:hypothetical protein
MEPPVTILISDVRNAPSTALAPQSPISSRRWRHRSRLGAGRALLLAVVACTALAGSACAGHSPRPAASAGRRCVPLEVDNHNWGDVVVTLLYDGSSLRLGLVTAASKATLVVPERVTGSSHVLQLNAHAVGNPRRHTSERFTTSIGEVLEWDLESELTRSSLAIRQLPTDEADSLISSWCANRTGGAP